MEPYSRKNVVQARNLKTIPWDTLQLSVAFEGIVQQQCIQFCCSVVCRWQVLFQIVPVKFKRHYVLCKDHRAMLISK